MVRRKRLRKKTFTYIVGFPPYAKVKDTNGFNLKLPAGQLFPAFGAKVTVKNGHLRKVSRGR